MKPRLRPILLTVASVLLPGLGHVATGRRRAALLFLVPTLLVITIFSLWALSRGTYGVAATLVTPGALTLLFAGNILVAGWRTSAAVDAVGNSDPGRLGMALSALVIVLAVGIPHLLVADTISAAETFLDDTFAGVGEVDDEDPGTAIVETPMPDPTEPPEATDPPPGQSPEPSASVGPTPIPTPSSRHTRRTVATARSRGSAPRFPGCARTRRSRGATTAASTSS